jgi:hypothetical protein
MMLRSFKPLLLALLMLPVSLGALAADENVAKGTIAEMGYGKFRLKENGGLERLYLVGKKDTSYEPNDWRPEAGDQIAVDFFQKKDKLVAGKVTLVKLGPNNVDPKQMVSPLRVVVRETGKSGIIATLKGTSKAVKFSSQRKKTKYEPVGWVPAAGEEIEIEFTTAAAKFTYDIAYVMSKVTRISK